MKHAFKHDFIISELLSSFRDHIFGGHSFAAYTL